MYALIYYIYILRYQYYHDPYKLIIIIISIA